MITNQGKTVVNSFFAGQTRQLGGALVFGTGTTAASSSDKGMGFEVLRVPLTSTAADLGNNRVVYKATIPAGLVSQISEVGLLHQYAPDSGRNIKITEIAGWVNATITPTNARAHAHSVQVSANASATVTATLTGAVSYDLSTFGQSDLVSLAGTADANTASVAVSLGSDSSNYYTWNFTPAVGYTTVQKSFSTATTTGSPVLASVAFASIKVTAKAGGTTQFYLDGFRMDKATTTDELVARTVLGSIKSIDQNIPTDIEYSLGVSIG